MEFFLAIKWSAMNTLELMVILRPETMAPSFHTLLQGTSSAQERCLQKSPNHLCTTLTPGRVRKIRLALMPLSTAPIHHTPNCDNSTWALWLPYLCSVCPTRSRCSSPIRYTSKPQNLRASGQTKAER